MRQCLHRLAETHVVGEHAAQSRRSEELQPIDPLALVWAQRRSERCGHRSLGNSARLAQRPAEVSQCLTTSPDQAGAFLKAGEFGGIQAAESDFSAILVDP